MTDSRYEALEVLQQQAADALQLPIDHEKVQSLAALRLAHRVQTERLVAGANVEPNVLLALSDAISRIAPLVALPKIQLEIVRPTDAAPADAAAVDGLVECRRCRWKPEGNDRVSKCYRCGWRHGDDINGAWKPSQPSEPPVIDGEVIQPAKPVLPAPPRAAPATPEPPRAGYTPYEQRKRPSIHDGWLGNTPARMSGPSYASLDSGGTSNPFGTIGKPKPDFGAHHPLPPVDWDVLPK